MAKINTSSGVTERIASVDFFRGFTMFLLIGESTLLFDHFLLIEDSSIMQFLGVQLSHHKWHGLRFWDLIQPFFMFIVGVAIPFATANRLKKGDSEKQILHHALKRSFLLLFFGWSIACVGSGKIVFMFQNVLSQLAVTYLISFLIMKRSVYFQLIFSFIILVITDLAYRYFPVAGFNHPWIVYENLGAWVNNFIEGTVNSSTWATLNALPTTAHTIWGVLSGLLLMSKRTQKQKIAILLIAGITALLIGYSLDILNITPIIKRIATSSFVFVSGGWTILMLTLSFWLIDVKKLFSKGSGFFIIVGTNSIFIYLFFSYGGAILLNKIFNPFALMLFSWGGEQVVYITTAMASWAFMWYMCYWLFKNKIFIKI